MSFKSSAVVPQWTRKISSPEASTSTNAEFRLRHVDSLVIEDLDLADLEISSTTEGLSDSTAPEESSLEGYPLHSDSDPNDIFGEHISNVVSKAYLMDELYILVKVPTNQKKHILSNTAACQTSPKSPSIGKLSPSLGPNGSRRIFPILEEEEEHLVEASSGKTTVRCRQKSLKPCWVQENSRLEEFQSTTKVFHSYDACSLPNQVPEQTDEPLIEDNPPKHEPSLPCQNQIEFREVDLSSNSFKSGAKVSLENYGILITPTKAPRSEHLLVFQVDTEKSNKSDRKNSSCFGWLSRLFYRRKRKRTGFVHAKVYKTYFVKWKKCSEEHERSVCRCRLTTNSRRNTA